MVGTRLFMLAIAIVCSSAATQRVFYAGSAGKNEAFYCSFALSDGTILVGGAADDLSWVSSSVTKVQLSATADNTWTMPTSVGGYAGQTGFILHLSADITTILRVVSFPTGQGGAVRSIKSTSQPGGATGALYISAELDANGGTYWIGKLDANFVTAAPTKLAWAFGAGLGSPGIATVNGAGIWHSALWDVDGNGRVFFYYSKTTADWGIVRCFKADGSGLDQLAHWYDHGTGSHGVSLKPANNDMRSTNSADYNYVHSAGGPDSHSKIKGKYPYDYYFSDYNSSSGPGYTGYSSDGHNAQSFAVAVDRTTNDIYIAFGNGNPQNTHDFEAMLVSFTSDGTMRWFSRMKDEWVDTNDNGIVDSGETYQSPPDQYADELAIDYASSQVVIIARSHGNAPKNFWPGDAFGGSSFHNTFTGNNGNEHMCWLGRFRLSDGTFADSTWVAEYDPWSSTAFGSAYTDPILDGWPSHNSGWPSLKTTKAHWLQVDSSGLAYILATSRGPVTTSNAYLKMPQPNNDSPRTSCGPWSDFVRVHTADFTSLAYSSALCAPFNATDGNGGGGITLQSVIAVDGGLLAVGFQDLRGIYGSGTIAASNIPSWGGDYTNPYTNVTSRDAFVSRLLFDAPGPHSGGSSGVPASAPSSGSSIIPVAPSSSVQVLPESSASPPSSGHMGISSINAAGNVALSIASILLLLVR